MKSRLYRGFFLFISLLAAAGVAYGDAASTPPDTVPDYQIKGDFIYNFATFIDWPESLGKSIVMCVAVPQQAMKYFSILDGKPVGDKQLVVRHLSPDDSAEDCRILYVADSESDDLEDWLSEIQDENVLTVAESDTWLSKGVIVVMQVQDGRVVFDVNMDAARGEEIRINSRLLRLARRIRGLESTEEPGDKNAK